ETEVLVEHALVVIADVERPVVVDVGTGTGAIALAIADERRDARVIAIDVSLDAVALARENAAAAGLEVAIHQGDLLDAVPDDLRGRVDLVVSNPPYLAPDALEDLPDEVRADPELALVGGLPVYVRLADAAAGVVRPGGSVAVEIGETQARDVAEVLRDAAWTAVAIEQDLTGRDRVVVASRAR
ncbi:MAG TPA: HemK/PrmC family methyltransferase, partial [Actinomycetota bacterium]|nr:HemK/PrmC family methyltransferase [Actinomycetota bacterium]